VGGIGQPEVEGYSSDPKKWFKSNHLSFYTDWSQMFVSCYEESCKSFAFTLLVAKWLPWYSGSMEALRNLTAPTSMLPRLWPAVGSEYIQLLFSGRRRLRAVLSQISMDIAYHCSER
jgi:hypothetical protein